MADQLTVYGRATSSNVQALLWGLEELGLSYARLDYGEVHGGLDTDLFRGLTPHGKIPVLTVGDTAIWETAAILRYLADVYGGETFWPKDPLQRAQIDMWAEWAKYDIAEAFTVPVFWRSARSKPENRDPDLVRRNLDYLESQLAIAEPRLVETPFLCGDALTLADIQFGHALYRYFTIDLDRRDLPALRAYYDRLTQRLAYQRAVMVSYQELLNTV